MAPVGRRSRPGPGSGCRSPEQPSLSRTEPVSVRTTCVPDRGLVATRPAHARDPGLFVYAHTVALCILGERFEDVHGVELRLAVEPDRTGVGYGRVHPVHPLDRQARSLAASNSARAVGTASADCA